MNRVARTLRLITGLVMLCDLVVFFLPITELHNFLYGSYSYSQYDYVMSMFYDQTRPDLGSTLSSSQIAIVILLFVLPFILVLIGGVVGIVGSHKQILTAIISYALIAANIVLIIAMPAFFTDAKATDEYGIGMAVVLHIIISAVTAILSIISMIYGQGRTLSKVEKAQGALPSYDRIRDEEQNERLPDVQQEWHNPPAIPPYDSSTPPRGILRGLVGIYATAEILMADGETIKLGRNSDNDLVFSEQQSVSRNHCQITWHADKGIFTILDTSSSGTFKEGSEECLPQNIPDTPLEPGTVLLIGSADNQFRLE